MSKPTKTTLTNFYQQIAAAQTEKAAAKDGNKDYLKPKPGNTYLVKIVPWVKDPIKTFVDYEFHGWDSVKTNAYTTTGTCPREHGGKCPVCEAGYASYTSSEQYKGDRKSKLLLRRKTHMTNVYVIDDPVNPENNGTVKVLRYGTALAAKINDVLIGDEKDDIGPLVFDFAKTGAVFKIICDRKGGSNSAKAPPTYERSKFVTTGKNCDLSQTEFEAICEQAKDLHSLIPKTKSTPEIEQILQVHFHGVAAPQAGDSNVDLDEDDHEEGSFKSSNQSRQSSPLPGEGDDDDIDIDPAIKGLLDGLTS